MKILNDELHKLTFDYYKNYYKSQLGLKDWEQRVNLRLEEEINFSQNQNFELLKNNFNLEFEGKKILVVGSGTGGECIFFSKKNMDVIGIEPNQEANQIAKLKINKFNLKNIEIKEGMSENIDFEENYFDFVYCYSVLEHVKDVKKSIDEMIRVLKNKGYLLISTPDYRQFYEPHYKLPLPMFLPKIINKLLLFVLRRPTKFLDTLNLVNSKELLNIFSRREVIPTRIYHQIPNHWFNNKSIQLNLIKYITIKFGIQKTQFWLIKKNFKND